MGTKKIAFVGPSGSGKSSLINRLRGLSSPSSSFNEDWSHAADQAALTGVVPTTDEAYCYIDPNYPDVELWDFPSFDVPNFHTQKIELCLASMNHLILVITILFCTPQDIDVFVKKILPYQKPYTIVVTKADEVVTTQDDPNYTRLREQLRTISAQTSAQIFLVTSRSKAPQQFDFPAFHTFVFSKNNLNPTTNTLSARSYCTIQ